MPRPVLDVPILLPVQSIQHEDILVFLIQKRTLQRQLCVSPSCILSRKPQKEREKNAVKQLNHFSTIMRDLLLDYWFKNQHQGLYCWTGDAKVNTEGFTAKLVMQKSIPRFFLPNWWCKSQHRCFHCWTGDANVNIEGYLLLDWLCKSQQQGIYSWTGDAKVNTEGFSAELVMQKSTPVFYCWTGNAKVKTEVFTAELGIKRSTPRSLLLNWWFKGQHRPIFCWSGDEK